MFSITRLLSLFFNRISNGIYPEQSIDNYNKEKREELELLKTEHNINDDYTKELQTIKIQTLNNIKNKLKMHTNLIINIIKDNDYKLTILHRIYHILYNLLKNEKIFNDNNNDYDNNDKINKLDKFINSLIYTSPFDDEDIIIDRLLQFIDYLSLNFPNNYKIKKVIEEDILTTSIINEIENINTL